MNVIRELRLQIIADWLLQKAYHHVVSKTDWWEFIEGKFGEHMEYLTLHEVYGMIIAFHASKPVAWIHQGQYCVLDEDNEYPTPTLKSVSSTQTRKGLQATTIHTVSKNP